MYPADNLPEINSPLESSERKLLLYIADLTLIISGIIGSLWYSTGTTQSEFGWELLVYQLPWIVIMAIGY